ncbi:hypothetical protein [Microcoleus sp. herbarium14]|uniref:hypothetical protein n=1 Tax=Microcoleus sp. herbarium14 TaxID=3055439 RepID=UPI002FD3ACC9
MIKLASNYTYVEDLWIITTYFNPVDYRTKLINFNAFKKNIEIAGINLVIIECTFKDQPFSLNNCVNVIQIKAKDIMWQKERLLNLALYKLPDSCKKVAWVDCDILFANPDWALETSKLLDDLPIVQLFDTAIRLPKDHLSYTGEGDIGKSFSSIRNTQRDEIYKGHFFNHGHTGFAWAARKELLLKHGFYDACIVGGGDHLMAHAMYGDWLSPCIKVHTGDNKYHLKYFLNWGEKFYKDVLARVGYVSGSILHLWHGDKINRKYGERNIILNNFGFDPANDISIDENGCWKWNSDKANIHQWTLNYFLDRKEDGDLVC